LILNSQTRGCAGVLFARYCIAAADKNRPKSPQQTAIDRTEALPILLFMDILDRLLGHDAWTTRQLLLRCEELTDEELDREFDIAHRSVRATLLHMIRNMEVWTDLIAKQAIRPNTGSEPEDRSIAGLLRRLDLVASDLARISRRIADAEKLDDCFVDHLDNPPRKKPYGGAIVHVITHSMHHRAQLLYMLRRLGVQDLIEGDALSWELQLHSAN
jgi:uncharacterized damage-inducible protein DinB